MKFEDMLYNCNNDLEFTDKEARAFFAGMGFDFPLKAFVQCCATQLAADERLYMVSLYLHGGEEDDLVITDALLEEWLDLVRVVQDMPISDRVALFLLYEEECDVCGGRTVVGKFVWLEGASDECVRSAQIIVRVLCGVKLPDAINAVLTQDISTALLDKLTAASLR